MNLIGGFRRITLVLSLLVGLIAGVSAFVGIYETCDYNRRMYYEYKNDYENITMFWLNWDTDGWDVGQRAVVRHLLNSRTEYGGAEFVFGDKTVTLHCWDVFPGINKDMLSMPIDILDAKAQTAKENALKRIEENLKSYDSWAKITFSGVILLGMLGAFVGAAVGYLGAWVVLWFGGMALYKFGSKFIRWLVQGFRDNTPEQVEKVEPTSEMKKIKQILKRIFMPQSAKKDERFSKIAKQIAERHNKYGVTLTDPRTGEDLLAGMTDEQREKYRQFKIKTSNIKQKETS